MDELRRTALFLHYRLALARFARRLVSDPEDAEDLLQDLVILVIAHPTGPTDENSFHAWCRGLMRNIAAHHWRKMRRTERTAPVGLDICDFAEETCHDDPELLTDVRKRLEALGMDEGSFDLLRRRYVLGETSGEIARSLGRSPDSVRMRLMRLRSILRGADGDREVPSATASALLK
jgi:RNA polymerase sigma factor (sigma-70 family)